MSLFRISIFILAGISLGIIQNIQWKKWLIFVFCILFMYWLQPISTIRNLDFWLTTISIGIALVGWQIVFPGKLRRNDLISVGILIGFFTAVYLMERFTALPMYLFTSTVSFHQFGLFLLIFSCIFLIFILIQNKQALGEYIWLIFILLLFIILKSEILLTTASKYLRYFLKQDMALAVSNDIQWVGFSYFSFRILHTLIESKRNRLRNRLGFRDYFIYIFYFPALLAGPIDRLEHFFDEINEGNQLTNQRMLLSGEKIFTGLFMKYLIADNLAILALNENLAYQIDQPGWMWGTVIMYALMIFFDFAGYTQIVLGVSEIIGISLPKNFEKPYRSPTIAIFWNRWHITLSKWFRTYFFNPLSRILRRKKILSGWIGMFIMQLGTMLLIGLWHGISWNFLIWGIWNGLGLFLHNRISNAFSKALHKNTPLWQTNPIIKVVSTTGTFIFISMGWVWFALPTVGASLRVFQIMFGMT